MEIKIPIKNEGTITDTIYLSVWPSQWVTVDKYWLTINPDETQLVSLFITPPETAEEGIHVFIITANSLNTNKTETKSLYLNVQKNS